MLGLIFLFVLFFIFTGVRFITFSIPFPLYYNDGDVLKLICVIPSNYEFQSWTLARGGSISASRGRYVVLREEKKIFFVYLIIANASKYDVGVYHCYASK